MKKTLISIAIVAFVLAGNNVESLGKQPDYLKKYTAEYRQDPRQANLKWFKEAQFGTFDGTTFISDKKAYQGDYGPNFYAGQTFSNSPDKRTVMMGCMNGGTFFQKAEMPFNQQMSFPATMELRTTSLGIRLYRWPVKEIEKLYVKSFKFKNLTVKEAENKLSFVKAELIDMSIEFEPKNSLTISIRGLDVTYDLNNGIFIYGSSKITAPVIDGKVKLRILLDRASIELFANDGGTVSTCYAVAETGNQSISISAEGDTKINSLIINKLNSSWRVEE